MTSSVDIRARLVDLFRRDLIGPGPQDPDIAAERLNESPSRWYLTGFLAPADDPLGLEGEDGDDDPSAQEEMEIDVEESDTEGAGGAAGDNEEPETPNTRRRFLPSSVGLTVLLSPDVKEPLKKSFTMRFRHDSLALTARIALDAAQFRRV